MTHAVPSRPRHLVRLRRDPDLVRRVVTGLPPGMWEDYVYRFGDFLEDPYELVPDVDSLEESLPLDSDGAATSPLPFEDLSQGVEDIDPQLLTSTGAMSGFAPEDPGPDPEPDTPICWEACDPIPTSLRRRVMPPGPRNPVPKPGPQVQRAGRK